ncbi:MAG: PEP-CTERM sorting domain-containing protein [Planctomycetota bacterium]|jgi:DNA-binding beta-propeller fold protein YncE
MRRQSSAIVGIFLMILCLSLSSELYAEAILYGSDADFQKLYTIDTTNAIAVEVGSFGVERFMAGLAYDADNDIMYGTTTGTNRLYSIDYRTGGATFIGDLGVTLMHGLAYDNSTDMLFGAYGDYNENGLYLIDVTTGNSTLIGNIGDFYSEPYGICGLAVNPITNDLYGVIGGPFFFSALVRINKSTGSGMVLHRYNSIQNMSGLAFLPDGTLYTTDNWSGNLYTLDILSGSTQLIGDTGLGNALGLTCVPEPTTLLLLALGAVMLRKRR